MYQINIFTINSAQSVHLHNYYMKLFKKNQYLIKKYMIKVKFHPETAELRCRIFYCHPLCSGEKGSCEKNHEFIRYVLPKGTVFSFLNQTKVNLMMSHINSTARPSIKGTPYEFMQLAYGTEVIDKLQIKKIDSKEVSLLPLLVK